MRGYIITFDRINNRMGFYNKGSSSEMNGGIFNTFDPIYFVAMQYVISVLSVIIAIVGLILWNVNRGLLEDRVW